MLIGKIVRVWMNISLVYSFFACTLSLPKEMDTSLCIIKRGYFFDNNKEYAVVLKKEHTETAFIETLGYPFYSLIVLVQNKSIDTLWKVEGLPIDDASIDCEIEDYNFDGQYDIVVKLYTSARGNHRKCIFLYDPIHNTFGYVTNSHQLHSLSVNDSLQLIQSDFEIFNDEIADYFRREDYYKYEGNVLVLEKSTSKEQ